MSVVSAAKPVVNVFWQQQITITSYEIPHTFRSYVRNKHVVSGIAKLNSNYNYDA